MIFGGRKKTTDVQESSTTKDDNTYIEIDKLVDFRKGQPFSMYDETKLENMKESIRINGVIMPIIVRPIEDDKYEIIAGHNRVRCARELGHTTIKANIIECDDDKATLILLDTNLCQRDELKFISLVNLTTNHLRNSFSSKFNFGQYDANASYLTISILLVSSLISSNLSVSQLNLKLTPKVV